MQKPLDKLFLLLISLSFILSATETDVGEVHHTFFDQFDTYIKNEQVFLDNTFAVQSLDDSPLVYFTKKYNNFLLYRLKKVSFQPILQYSRACPKDFILNSVWLI